MAALSKKLPPIHPTQQKLIDAVSTFLAEVENL
jgi:hypothetical protein